ncbi:MAG: hypothetical protein ACFFCS_08350 [Candidatus Hodarchaeota archaeon]
MNDMTTNTNGLEISRRDFMRAMTDIPSIMSAPDSVTLNSYTRVKAAFYDFMNHELDLDTQLALINRFLTSKIHRSKLHLLLVFLGFLSSPIILPFVRKSIEILKQKVNVGEYIIQELFTLISLLNKVVFPEKILLEEERKEEVARKLLEIFKIGIEGESIEESKSILGTLDSVEIKNLSEELEVKIRAQIQKRLDEQAKAAAAKPSRE